MHVAIYRKMYYTAKVRLFILSICKQTSPNANLCECHFSYASLKVCKVQENYYSFKL